MPLPDVDSNPLPSLTAMLARVALDVAEAQAALDARAEAQAAQASENGDALPPLAFYFPRVELDLALAFTVTRGTKGAAVSVLPPNPTLGGLFQSTSFSSRLRAVIAPRAVLVPEAEE